MSFYATKQPSNQATKQPSNQATKQPSNIAEVLANIKLEIQKIRDHTPRVGVFGNSGVGKSTLCNALFGDHVASVSDVTACTREPQEILVRLESGKGGIILVDLPGIGETDERQKEYVELYQNEVAKLDVVLWATMANDRNYHSALEGYKAVRSVSDVPIIFVITQINKIEPMDEWDNETFTPTGEQETNRKLKEHTVATTFDVSPNRVISVAVHRKNIGVNYQLKELVERIVEVLPNPKKYAITREAKAENVTETARVNAEKGILDHIKEMAGDVWEAVKENAVTAVIASAPRVLASLWSRLKFW